MKLYLKVMKGKKVTYQEYIPEEPTLKNSEFEPEEIVTMVGTMGICLIESIGRLLPPHKKIAVEIKKVEQALLGLYKNTGQPLDSKTVEYTIDCWNETMRRLAKGIPQQGGNTNGTV